MSAQPPPLFVPARHVADPAECTFYHYEELPEVGLVGTQWDLRGVEEAYLGGVTFSGRRVLEMGSASGYLCRAMEKRERMSSLSISRRRARGTSPPSPGSTSRRPAPR